MWLARATFPLLQQQNVDEKNSKILGMKTMVSDHETFWPNFLKSSVLNDKNI